MKKIKFILFILLTVFSLGCVIYAGVMQCILSYEKFGVIFNDSIFIPDESAWWFLGVIGLIPFWVWEKS